MRFLFIQLLLILVADVVQAQPSAEPDHHPDQLIVMLKPGVSADQFCVDLEKKSGATFQTMDILSQNMNIWLIGFDDEQIDVESALLLAEQSRQVEIAQFNHTNVQLRAVPNDSLFNVQWSLLNDGSNGGTGNADIDAEHAWDIATGGLTALGDTIVVAVIDDGFSLSHVDLHDNFWVNRAEIPDNNIDDDNNGFVDDWQGWNFYSEGPNHPNSYHGTHVTGIIGARGNNEIGISGVNWNVKILPVTGSTGDEDIVVKAYSYVLEMRKRYNVSNGEDGAYIVAANSSFGVSFKTPEDLPLWCAMYDSLGQAGILSMGATDNLTYNVDVEGDIPSTCESDYLVMVTNSTAADELYSNAAYGSTSIDLAAPGRAIWSTYPGDFYGKENGTSAATPHVTGAIALMYSAACPELLEEYTYDPAGLALYMKERLLEDGVESLNSLSGKVSSGGRLDLYTSVLSVSDLCFQVILTTEESDCGSCNGSVKAKALGATGTVIFSWSTGSTANEITGLCPGVYSVTVTDGSAEQVVKTIALSDSGGPQVTVQKVSPTCHGASDGSVAATGGANYTWEDGGSLATRTYLAAGHYFLYATDAGGNCTTVVDISLVDPDSIHLTYEQTMPTTEGGSDGSLKVIPKGGKAPYVVEWETGSSSTTLSGISKGKYGITVTDANGCVTVDSAMLGYPSGIDHQVDRTLDFMRIYPNPVDQQLSLISEHPILHCSIRDVSGELVRIINNPSAQKLHFDTRNIPAGAYFIRVETEWGIEQEKLIILHD